MCTNVLFSTEDINRFREVIAKRGYDLGEILDFDRDSAIFSDLNDSSISHKIVTYSRSTIKQLYFMRAAYELAPKLFPRVCLIDPWRKREFESDMEKDSSRDLEADIIRVKGKDYFAFTMERLNAITELNETGLLRLILNVGESLAYMGDPLRFAVTDLCVDDIMYSYKHHRYMLANFSAVQRFCNNEIRLLFPSSSPSIPPEALSGIYTPDSAVYALGTVIRSNLNTILCKDCTSNFEISEKNTNNYLIQLLERMTDKNPDTRIGIDRLLREVKVRIQEGK